MRIVIDLQGAQTESRFRGIGRYSLSLALAMARNAGEHEVWIALNGAFPDSVSDIRRAFEGLLPEQRIRVFDVPIPVAEVSPENAWRARAAEKVREHFLQQIKPDFVHVSSLFEGYVDNGVASVGSFAPRLPTAVTLYDLIPLLNAETYLATDAQRNYYLRKIESLKNARVLLAISESSRREGIDSLQLSEDRVINISAAIDGSFRPLVLTEDENQTLRERYQLRRNIIMYAPGGFDPRKNVDGLIRAYAMLPSDVRSGHQLVIVSRINASQRANLEYLRKQENLADDEVVFTGYAPDEDLVILYNMAVLFVLPSKHEGFGLPALEAMACGAPTIGSNISSIPEVIGLADALFDPLDPQSMAEKIRSALTDENFNRILHEHASRQASKFSWDTSAQRALGAFERLKSRQRRLTWRNYLKQAELEWPKLINEIGHIPCDAVGPSDLDLRLTASSIAENHTRADRLARVGELPRRITWRIEGPFDSSYSLALLNRETAVALDLLGHHVVLHSTEGPGDFAPDKGFLDSHPELACLVDRAGSILPEDADVTSRNLYPPRVADMRCRLNLLHHYAWEESGFPQDWAENFNEHLQGITCLSRHVEKVMIDHGVSIPLAVSGCGVDHWERIVPDEDFRVSGRTFRFLHVSSCFPRKGADVLLKAYGQAFRDADDVTLIIKTFPNPHNEIHRWLSEAKRNTSGYPDVVIIENDLAEAELKALYLQCHVLVAPSRAEGFGLPMAEAMLSGLAVITTGWSGQLDFCNDETAWLVDYSFEQAETHFGLFDSVWAVPDVDHLARILRQVHGTPAAVRSERSVRARSLLLDQFRWSQVAERLVASARSWAQMPVHPEPRVGWITTWNTRCGIASYSAHLINAMSSNVTVLAAHTADLTHVDRDNVFRCWRAGDEDSLDGLARSIDHGDLDTLVLQFNYGFFGFDHLDRFLTAQLDAGRVVVIALHATNDPSHAPEKKLEKLAGALRRCHRILVHAPADLNRLKDLGLIHNVTLFPHGILDYDPPRSAASSVSSGQGFTIASYGFFLPHKGLLELIHALALVRQRGQQVRLRMVNAEYPNSVSSAALSQARELIARLGLGADIELRTDYLSDEESLACLASSDLIVFPYQETGESSSAAVRYGLASGRPVAVTPLAIFQDVSPAVCYLPGTTPDAIASGIAELLLEIASDTEVMRTKTQQADRWREAHRYSRLAQRLDGTLKALSRWKGHCCGSACENRAIPLGREQIC